MQVAHPLIRPAPYPGVATHELCAKCGIRQHSVCSAIADADLDRLSAAAVGRSLTKGQTLVEEGQPATDFFSVTHGTLKLFKLLPDGRQQITGFAGPGHFLGLAVSQTYAFSAEAIEPTRLCRFSRPKLRQMLDDFPAMERRLLETACNELAAAHEQMLLLGRKTARERVASFLVLQGRSPTPCAPETDCIHLPMTRAEIADYLGLTIETVSRTLTRMRADGLISTPGLSEVAFLDRARLEAVAAGSGG